MPRVQVNYPDLMYKDYAPESTDGPKSDYGPWNDSSAHVQWQGLGTAAGENTRRGIGWIQVGLEVDNEYARFALANCNGSRPDRTIMWTPVLSPAEADRMISALKRAKRKAFRTQ